MAKFSRFTLCYLISGGGGAEPAALARAYTMEITATFTFNGEAVKTVATEVPAVADTPAKPVDDSKFSFGYTGRHDGGSLLPVNNTSPYFGLEHAVGVSDCRPRVTCVWFVWWRVVLMYRRRSRV